MIVLALAVTYYAHEAREAVPREARAADAAWASALRGAADRVADAAGSGATAAVAIPAAPAPGRVGLPLVAALDVPSPSGSVRFEPACGNFTAAHAVPNASVQDAFGLGRGCLTFEVASSSGGAIVHRYEMGALLRVEAERAVIVRGPALLVEPGASLHRLAITVPTLTGPASAVAVGGGGARVDLARERAPDPLVAGANALQATWSFESTHPAAWHAWLEGELARAGLVAGTHHSLACEPVGCAPAAGATGRVTVSFVGPGASGLDVGVSVAHPVLSVRLS